MCKLVPGKSSLLMVLGAVVSFVWLVLAPPVIQAEEKGAPPPEPPPARGSEIVFTGKFFCSLKRPVPMPFKGTVTSLKVKSGQRVEAGQVLARYRLSPEATLQVQQRLTPAKIKELEMKQAEVERNLVSLEVKQMELNQLTQQNLAPPLTKTQTDREVQQLVKQKKAVAEHLSQERQQALEDQAFLKSQLGILPNPGQVPREAALVAPVSGYIIWVHPDLREGAELDPTKAVFQIGVMDPMVVRAQVYEIEALQLTLGEGAEVSVESLPGKNFEATVSRISWAPVPPSPYAPAGQEQPSYYEVELNVPNPDLLLKEGLKGRVTLRKSR